MIKYYHYVCVFVGCESQMSAFDPHPLALGTPPHSFFPSAKIFVALFFILMHVMESIFDKVQCCGGVNKCKLLANWKMISSAIQQPNELYHTHIKIFWKLIENFSKSLNKFWVLSRNTLPKYHKTSNAVIYF